LILSNISGIMYHQLTHKTKINMPPETSSSIENKFDPKKELNTLRSGVIISKDKQGNFVKTYPQEEAATRKNIQNKMDQLSERLGSGQPVNPGESYHVEIGDTYYNIAQRLRFHATTVPTDQFVEMIQVANANADLRAGETILQIPNLTPDPDLNIA